MTTKINLNEITPFVAIHPGELIKDELKARSMTQKDLASLMDMQTSVLNDIIKEKRNITTQTAILLESALDIKASHWLKLQNNYDIDKEALDIRIIKQKKDIEIWRVISQYITVGRFKKLGLFTENISENINMTWEIFKVKTVDDFLKKYAEENEDYAYFKKSEKLSENKTNLFCWKNYTYYKSLSLPALNRKFDKANLNALIRELNKIFTENCDTINRTEKVLNKYGINFIVLNKFDKTPIDGFSFWLAESQNPTMVLTLRLQNIDNFAFAIMHELCHIINHIKPLNYIYGKVSIFGSKEMYEIEANKFARQSLIPELLWKQFMKECKNISPHKIQEPIKRFSKEYNINPTIVFGFYKYDINFYSIKSNIIKSIN
ncbi:MAG: HigA family addiction module antitoxin [Muribaculaceae bacterium]